MKGIKPCSMNRRALLQTALLTSLGLSNPALASSSGAKEPAVFDMTMIGFPVIRQGRLLNYVFVNMKLHLAEGVRPETVQLKEAMIRDAVVRTAHRTPFVLPDKNTELNLTALTAEVRRQANRLLGSTAVTRVEVVNQMSRRR